MSEERFDRIDAGLKKLTILHEETRDRVKLIAEGLGSTNERIDRLEDRMDKRFDGVYKRFDGVDQRLHRIETLLTRHDGRIAALEARPPLGR